MVVIGSKRVLAAGRWRWLRALGWLTALCVVLVATFNAVAKAVLLILAWGSGIHRAPTSLAPVEFKLAAAVAGCIALLAAYWLAVRFGERRSVPELDLRRGSVDLIFGLAIGAAVMATITGLLWLFHWASIEPRRVDAIGLALRDSIRSGVVEELVLRLVIFRLLWRAFGVWPALVVAAALFGALHLANPDSSLFAAACLIAGEGIGIGLYLITGRIWAPIGMHAAWNFTQGWVFGAIVSGTDEIAGGPLTLHPVQGVPIWLSGGGFGPEASMAALAVSLIASAVLLRMAWARGDFTAADAGTAEHRARGMPSPSLA